jgi:PKD repeat protein
MKINLTHLRLFVMLLYMLGAIDCGKAQTCTVNFSATIGAAGNVTFTSLSTNTTVNSVYSWTFGNNASFTGTTNAVTVVTNYSVNGTYTVVLSVNNGTCSNSFTQTININNAPNPPCSLQIAYTAPTGTTCNGSATVTGITNACGAVTYTWAPGFSMGAVANGLCPGNTYTVFATSVNGFSCCSAISGTIGIPACSLAVSVATTSPGGGVVNFTSTSTGTVAGSTYLWNFGDGSPLATGNPTTHTYSSNTLYNAQLKVFNPTPGCADSLYFSVNLNTPPCNLTAGFTYNPGASGLVGFTNTSIGTTSSTIYIWDPGDSSPSQTVTNTNPVTHTYNANGIYTAILTASAPNFPCVDSAWQVITINNVPAPCNLVANFTTNISPGGIVYFTNTSTGTNTNTTYSWSFPGSTNSVSTVQNPTVTYPGTGFYTVLLQASNNASPPCTSTKTLSINIPCVLDASFSHTLGALGQATFQSTSTGTTASTTYVWNFGDGVSNSGNPFVHTYVSSGAYNVSLQAFFGSCQDTVVQSVNVTGLPCVANANFTLVPTGTPQYWNGIPAAPWNVSAAAWDWGDGSVSNTLYTSHTYSAAGNYNICLSVTVSCASSASSCSSYSVYRSQQVSQDLVFVNIIKPGLSTSIENLAAGQTAFELYPNPNNGNFTVRLSGLRSGPAVIQVYNLVGELVYEKENESAGSELSDEIYLRDVSTGLYLVRISSGGQVFTKKIIVSAP